jgi:epoxyqueuosine reductase
MTSEDIKSIGTDLGFSRVGICSAAEPVSLPVYQAWVEAGYHASMDYLATSIHLRSTLESLLPGAASVVVCALNYHQPTEWQPGEPRMAQYALGRDYHKVLRKKLQSLARVLANHFPEAQFRAAVDSAPMLEREFAHRAGLGWYGKNTCLIDSRTGSYFVIGSLLTTLELTPDAPSPGGCGTCRACIDACPTGAIVQFQGRWHVQSERCISYLTIEHEGEIAAELQPLMGEWTFGCDVCQDVCPFNQARDTQPERAPVTREPDFAPRQWPNLQDISQISYENWDILTRGSPVRRAGHEGLKRNAVINLRNQLAPPPEPGP